GPNTGGMGAFAPSPLVDAALTRLVMHQIVGPVLDGMRAEGDPYRGFLYVSLMLTSDGPRVIEFNVRLGDPEAQVLLPLIGGDLARLLADGVEREPMTPTQPRVAVGVVLASAGYPGAIATGRSIAGLDRADSLSDVLIFHAGTRAEGRDIVT